MKIFCLGDCEQLIKKEYLKYAFKNVEVVLIIERRV